MTYKNTTRGFTLLETLVAILILTVAITGPLSIASRSLTNATVSKNQITAFFLAQDAVEYVRFARDSNALKGASWITGSGGVGTGIDLTACAGANGCYLDTTENSPATPTVCSTNPCPVINYDATNSRYTYAAVAGTVSATMFTRTIKLTSLVADEYNLAVTVSWVDNGGVSRNVVITENIFSWQ